MGGREGRSPQHGADGNAPLRAPVRAATSPTAPSRLFASLAAATVAVVALSGCGPSRAAALHAEVEAALAAAREAGAPERAPYEWTAAELYYGASKEDAGRSDYEGAAELAEKALELAERARNKAFSDPAPAPAPKPGPGGGREGGAP